MNPPVYISMDLISRIVVREWGLPTLVMPGKIWRSRTTQTISCMLPKGRDAVRTETRPLRIVETGSSVKQWMPANWRAAIWQYVKAYPYSGADLAPFLAVSDEKRNALIRELAGSLVKSDEIGCRSIAHTVGRLAAYVEWFE